MGGSKSLTNKIAFTTDSPLLSPVVDLTKSSDVVIQNLVDPISLDYNEYYGHGSSLSKYISQVVTLASGQDAQDLQITISAHRPPGTDIQVWARYLNREDTDPITAKTWGQLQNLSYNTYSSPTNPNDFQDITFATCPYYNPYQPQGNITVLVNNTTVTGYNTQFTQFTPGYYISSVGNSTVNEVAVQIVSIANDTSLTISQPFTATTNSTYCYANATYFMVPPPTTPWLGQVNSVQANGTVSTFTTNNAIVGANTLFTNEYRPGSVISVNGDSQPVTSISNNTLLYVSSSWTSNNTGANSYNVQSAGISYLNNQNSLFTTFASFQIKIILQSNDSSKVPILDNLRALALQL